MPWSTKYEQINRQQVSRNTPHIWCALSVRPGQSSGEKIAPGVTSRVNKELVELLVAKETELERLEPCQFDNASSKDRSRTTPGLVVPLPGRLRAD